MRASALLLVLTLPAMAQEPNLSSMQNAEPGAAARLILAQRTYEAALSTGDPVILISAIRQARQISLRDPAGWSKVTKGDAGSDTPEGRVAAPDPAGPEAIDIAQGLAGDDPDLQDLVYDLDAQLPHERRPKVVNAVASLDTGQADWWTLVLPGEAAAEVGLIGDGDSDLSLTITDEGGAAICSLPPSTEPALCRFTPARNGFFTIQVRNVGKVRNSYRLLGN